MKTLIVLPAILFLSACQSIPSTDPTSIRFDIPEGSTLTLNKDLPIENNNTHAVIQNGLIVEEKSKNLYYLSCRLELKAFGPRTIKPDTFQISHVEDNIEPDVTAYTYRYYTEVFLRSDHNSDIIMLECSVWGDPIDGSFPVADMQKTLGDYFTFNFAKPAP